MTINEQRLDRAMWSIAIACASGRKVSAKVVGEYKTAQAALRRACRPVGAPARRAQAAREIAVAFIEKGRVPKRLIGAYNKAEAEIRRSNETTGKGG